ncbi:hypothetical protein PENVUL_c024G04765 [Penicillium vulpinum]|uniref:Apple domain-containing protein n=1 Tax=Penicillium vulpinum TaxID=29845 RepID=A0A1V6RVH0_9EURO|nr:hypothetical protein PENVUL_c024G04765 [Penicillium vulpinum]
MQSTSILLLTFLLAIEGLFSSLVSASCFPSAQNETIGFFSKAPLAYGYTHLSPSECANECDSMSTCQAWLFVVNANECQFYRSAPVAQAKSAGFIMGSCDRNGTRGTKSTSKVFLPASSSVVPGSQTAQSSLSNIQGHATHLSGHKRGHYHPHHQYD